MITPVTTDPIILKPLTIDHAVRAPVNTQMPAIYPAGYVGDRQHMRKYTKHALKTANTLQAVIDEFIDAINNAPLTVSYLTIFDHYAEKWMNECIELKRQKFKYVVIDSHFFINEYKPKA